MTIMQFVAYEAAMQLHAKTLGWNRPVTVRGRGFEFTARESEWHGEPLIIAVQEEDAERLHAMGGDMGLVRAEAWRLAQAAAGSDIYPFVWARAMNPPNLDAARASR